MGRGVGEGGGGGSFADFYQKVLVYVSNVFACISCICYDQYFKVMNSLYSSEMFWYASV